MPKVTLSDRYEDSGILIRALVRGEITEEEPEGRTQAADFLLPYQPKPYHLRLVQNPLFNYEAMMAKHDELEGIRQEHRSRTGSDPLDAKWSDIRGLWLVAHWYIVEEYLDDLTVGMTIAAWEGLNRTKLIRLT